MASRNTAESAELSVCGGRRFWSTDTLDLSLRTISHTSHSHSRIIQSGPKKEAVVLLVVISSIMDQFKEIPLLERSLNFQKDVFY